VEQSPLADDKIVLHDEDRFDLTSLAVAVAVPTVRLGLGLTVRWQWLWPCLQCGWG